MSDDWQSLGAAGARALTAGQPAEAAERFARVVELRPDHADSWFNLAYALRQCRRYEEALAAYARAIEEGVAGAEEAHVNRAIILSEHLGRIEEAKAELHRAIALAPHFAPAWFNLGMLREDLGDAAAASDAYRSALAADPRMGRAQARLAAIATHSGEPAGAIAMLERALASSGAAGEDRAEMEFALGSALDAAGRYDEAFAAIGQANARMAALRPGHARYDPAAQERFVDAMIGAFPCAPSAQSTPEDRRPIFVCGMFRSGSTVIEQLLARHPAIAAGGELETLPALVRERLQPYPDSLARLNPDDVAKLRGAYLAEVDHLFPSAAHFTDKRPDNFLHLGLIKMLLPGARIVHSVRDLRDIAISTWFLNFASAVSYSERLDHIGHYLGQYRRLMDHWSALFGDDLITVDYDRLVREPAQVMDQTFGALDLDPAAASEQHAGVAAVIRTPSNWQARAPLHARSSGRWRNYQRQLASLLPALF